jgi:hypothetical protein
MGEIKRHHQPDEGPRLTVNIQFFIGYAHIGIGVSGPASVSSLQP